jgi:hypothetical protein
MPSLAHLEATSRHDSYSASNPPASSAYARRLATQISDRERRPQLFDTFAFIPSTIYGVIGYCVTTGVAVLYKDIQKFLTNDVSKSK